MRKTVALLTLVLSCAYARRHGKYRQESKLPAPVQGMKKVDSPDYSDPLDDIESALSRSRFEEQMPSNNRSINRDIFEDEQRRPDKGMTREQSQLRARKWYDLQAIHDINIQRPDVPKRQSQAVKPQQRFTPDEPSLLPLNITKEHKRKFFNPKSFSLMSDMPRRRFKPLNWTTCDEFGRGARYDPKDIIEKDWIPFYMWSRYAWKQAYVHKFAEVTVKTVKEYHEKFSKHLNKSIDWLQSKLLLFEGTEEESLLIAADRKGLYHLIMNRDLPDYVKENKIILPIITIRLKIVEPYLALTYCEEKLAYIMAVDKFGPQTKEEKTNEAAILKFRGRGRPVSRNIKREQKQLQLKKQKETLKEARKYLPVNSNYGLFPPELRDPPVGPLEPISSNSQEE